MAQEYNSKLVSQLYKESDDEKAIQILDEMDEIKDPIFIYPILDAYKKFNNTACSHYFLSSLLLYSSPDIFRILKEIALNSDTRISDIIWLLDYFSNVKFFDEKINERIKEYFSTKQISISEMDLDFILRYSLQANFLEFFETDLEYFFISDKTTTNQKRISLRYLLKIDPKKYLNYYLTNYSDIKDTQSEIVFAKTILTWKGSLIDKIKEAIVKQGSRRANEIISAAQEMANTKIKESEQSVVVAYSNADVVSDISKLRKNINTLTQSNENFGFPLFIESELISEQSLPAKDRSTLLSYCSELRSLIQFFNLKDVNTGIDYMSAKEIISDLREDDLNKPFNKFVLYLYSKGKTIDKDLFGLRSLNRLLNKFSHLESTDQLIEELKNNNLINYYINDEWQRLHRGILELYRDALFKIHHFLSSQ